MKFGYNLYYPLIKSFTIGLTNLMNKLYKLHLKYYIIFLLIFIRPFAGYSQTKELWFSYINTSNGLSNNIITCIKQDKSGFMWIGTVNGLNRYDGYNNKIFKKILNDTTSLADNSIYSIYIDNNNNIWIGTQTGLCLYNSDKENFNTYLLDSSKYFLNSANRVTGIGEDSKKQLYVVVEMGTLFYYNRSNGKFIKEPHNFESIKRFLIDKEDRFWFGEADGLSLFNKKTGQVYHFDTINYNNKTYILKTVNTLLEEGDTIWIGTINGQIYYVLKDNMQIRPLEYNFENTYYITDIYKGNDGLFYISTTDGLFIYDKKRNKSISYKYQKDNSHSLNCHGGVMSYQDRQGNFWIGTFQGGVNLSIVGKDFKNYDYFSKDIALDIINIHSVAEDHEGNIWIGSFDNGINVLNLTTCKKKLFMNNPNDPFSLGYGTLFTIFEDSKKNIWVGSYLGYLQRYDSMTNKFISYPFYPEKGKSSEGKDIRSIIEDKEGNLWLISHGFGMSKFNPNTGKFKHFKRDNNNLSSSLADNYAFQLLLDDNNYIWVATASGLSKFNPKDETFVNYYSRQGDSSSLCNNYVSTLFEDSYSNLWIGTTFGLDLFDKQKNSFVHFYEKDGLPSNQIKSILENKPGELWITTGNGLSCMKYRKDNNSGKIIAGFRNYNLSDNLQDIFFWERSACKTKKGELIFGCEKGIIMFKPDEIKDNTAIPEVYIVGFKLFNKPVEVGDYSALLKQNILHTKKIVLSYNQNYLSFDFVAMNYISRDNNQFAYKMEGLDQDWNYVGNKHEAIYTNLDPGKYIFRVKASNNDGIWNEKGVSLQIVILPPFWKTWWFKIMFIGICIISLLGFYFNRIRRLGRQQVILKEMVLERTKELEDTNIALEEKQEEINLQKEELEMQKDSLQEANKVLLDQQKHITEQNKELDRHRNELESLVVQRTRELEIAKSKAEESDRLKSTFLANMSHEIRTPMNSIVGFSNLLCDENLNNEDKKSFTDIIVHSSESLLVLINDILDISKIQAGQLVLTNKPINLDDLLDKLYETFLLETDKNNLKLLISKKTLSDKIWVETDEVRLIQVFNNLIGNAIKFTDAGSIEFGIAEQQKNVIVFFVKDTGIGIPPEIGNSIFEIFSKVENTRTKQIQGAGLGLAITKSLINLMGGEIWYESLLDKGTTFFFSVPFKFVKDVKIKSLQTNNQSIQFPDLSGKTILIAEDEENNFKLISTILKKTKANTIWAKNGIEAIELCKLNPSIDLIIMDIKMPLMDGIEANKKIKLFRKKVKIVAQTAFAYEDDIKEFLASGFDASLTKPIKMHELVNVLKKFFV